jgi:N-acetylneuraminic acid mutarotase
LSAVPPHRGRVLATGRLLARGLAVAVAAAVLVPVPALARTSAPASAAATSATGSATAEPVCGKPAPGQFGCFSMRRTDVRHGLGVQVNAAGQDVTPAGYSPADLRSAYNLPADGGAGATIAIVDAYDDPSAELDLGVYRQQFGLPACTTENGCFTKVDQRGGIDYPATDSNWAGEISLDLDMVSAVAPNAHIILVEADSASDSDLGAAENMAVSLGAEYVSNSWGGYSDTASNLAEDQAYYNHPGTAIVFSSGDYGYGVTYPAASPYVTAVGGTSLTRDSSSRGWHESVWNSASQDSLGAWSWGAPGSGCSAVEPKPSFQSDTGCSGRSVADVSAVADPQTGVAVYDSLAGSGGWNVYGGTSVSAPIISAVYALAGRPTAGTYPSSYPYETSGALNDVTDGNDASCASDVGCGFGATPACTPSYACQAGPGYDGPTGLGTPDGVAAFTPGPHGVASGTITDSSTGKPLTGATVTLGDYHTTTDSTGGYRLDVPPGSYHMTVSQFGYATVDLGTITLADGATLTKNAALTPVPSTTVSGTVRDGGGHGWGLYARITVDGVPGTTFTDPANGRYSLRLPQGGSYTLHTTALYPGYKQGSTQVDATAATATADVTLPVDAAGTLPPGYRMDYGGGEDQTFDAASTPAGWTVKNNTSAGGWNFTDPLNRGNQTGGSGHFAEVDDFAQGWANVDTELISPSYNFSSDSSPQLDFDTALPSAYRISPLTADVDVSTDNGATWTNVWHETGVVNGPAHESISLSAYGGAPSLRIRFHYVGSLTGIWEVDDVQIGSHNLQAVPGGLLVGEVRDANTGAGVPGATVRAVATPTDSARTVATPDDPAQGGGQYWLFSTATGDQQFSADLASFGYPAVTSTVQVTAGSITAANFALHPAQLKFIKESAGATVDWGKQKTVTVQVRNTGGSPATISLGEDGAPAPSAGISGAPLRQAPASQTPMGLATQVAATSTSGSQDAADPGAATDDEQWQSLTNLPLPDYGGAAVVIKGILYAGLGETPGGTWSTAFYSYDPATASWKTLASAVTGRFAPAYGVIRGKLYVVGGRDAAGNGISGGEVYDPATNTWSQIASAPYAYGGEGMAVAGDKLYAIGGCDFSGCGNTHVQVYDPATDTWSAGPDYPQPTSYLSCGTIDGVIYCAGGAYEPADGTETDTAAGYALDPASGAWRRIADAPTDFWGATSTTANGLLLSAGGQSLGQEADTNAAYGYDPATNTWSVEPNLPGPRIAAASASGWYVIGGTNAYNALQASVLELPGFDHPHGVVPWLSADPASATIGAGKTATITLTLDAAAMGPADLGSHYAKLIADNDTPYGSVSLPVTMTVVAPGDWGMVTGTVTAQADGTPVAGAVVVVHTKHGDTTLQTGADGGYQLWLPTADNPLTITVTASGYGTQTSKATLHGGHAVTVNVALSPQ